jgi:hypothetical protein
MNLEFSSAPCEVLAYIVSALPASLSLPAILPVFTSMFSLMLIALVSLPGVGSFPRLLLSPPSLILFSPQRSEPPHLEHFLPIYFLRAGIRFRSVRSARAVRQALGSMTSGRTLPAKRRLSRWATSAYPILVNSTETVRNGLAHQHGAWPFVLT